jgi:acetyl esterase/lipase
MALIILHGGGFTEGSHETELEHSRLFASLGLNVYPLEFVKSSLAECLADIRSQVKNIRCFCNTLVVLGKSSGGYMAKTLFEEGLFDYGIYVAPVLDPHKRGTLIPKLGKTARSFFKTRPPALTKWNANRELLLLASNDENVPKSCFTHVHAHLLHAAAAAAPPADAHFCCQAQRLSSSACTSAPCCSSSCTTADAHFLMPCAAPCHLLHAHLLHAAAAAAPPADAHRSDAMRSASSSSACTSAPCCSSSCTTC